MLLGSSDSKRLSICKLYNVFNELYELFMLLDFCIVCILNPVTNVFYMSRFSCSLCDKFKQTYRITFSLEVFFIIIIIIRCSNSFCTVPL